MLELEHPFPESFDELFHVLEHNLSSVSIIRGYTGSKIYADSMHPTWLVTYSNSRILVSGDLGKPEVVDAVQRVVDNGVESGRRGFVIYYPKDPKKTGLGESIQSITPYPNLRNYYVLLLGNKANQGKLPKGYRIEQITKTLLEEGLENTELVENEMRSERKSVQDFLDKSFGFCAISGDVIAAWCMSEYNADNRFEIGIETHTDHRRKGLALQTARACINHGIEKGYTQVGWHCWVKNEESNELAKRLGFKHVLNYPVEYLEVEK
jgi:GNAT superfamily N-acetyltransferase